MGDEEIQEWHYLDGDGQQQGPVSADDLQALAAQGTIHPETEVWTEGLDQWVPATHVEGLLPEPAHPHLVAGAAPVNPIAHPHLVTGTVIPQSANPIAAQAGALPGAPAAGLAAPAEGHYPPTPTKRAGFGKMLTFLIAGLVLLVAGPLGGGMLGAANGGDPENIPVAAMVLILGGYFGGILLILIGQILALIYLHRAWSLLQWGAPRTTPGKAVGLLFIPLFNFYWIFVAYYGLAKDWNRIMASYPDLQPAPRHSEGMALAACICLLIPFVNIVGGILLLVYLAQVCSGINFMAGRAMHQHRAGGIHLY